MGTCESSTSASVYNNGGQPLGWEDGSESSSGGVRGDERGEDYFESVDGGDRLKGGGSTMTAAMGLSVNTNASTPSSSSRRQKSLAKIGSFVGGAFQLPSGNKRPRVGQESTQDTDRNMYETPSKATPSSATHTKSLRLKRQPSTYVQVQKVVQSKLVGAKAKARGGIVGLANLGNTCFMNSAIQCLANCVPLIDYFMGTDWAREINHENFFGHKGAMAEAVGALMSSIWMTSDAVLSPMAFKKSVGSAMPLFAGYDQHDVQEFIAFVLDAVHEDLNRVMKKPYVEDVEYDGTKSQEMVAREAWKGYLMRNRSIIVDLFQGQLRSTLRCSRCGHEAIKFDPFMYLTVPVKGSGEPTLERCLELFCEEEELSGNDAWRCPKCKDFVQATKKLDLWKLPAVLIIHLKRFSCDSSGRRTKLTTLVDFPTVNLNLDSFVKSPQREAPDYDLFGVANHHGTLYGGHYTAFARNRLSRDWHLFNDRNFEKVDEADIISPAAYVLFYQKMEQGSAPGGRPSSQKSRRAGTIRRQSVTRPEHWPHVADAVEDGEG